ncbi:unnamed protein product [Medioppia subpectinata]|uniref:Uncharacterized protein n=1 Tax=Medioppia subpectinata TaxID=1979941 RepID=A0A7R9Q4U1_9ACAR|nr:unnamed protein product [Medioppia subpectinata]CAG2111711.1 unnamed protein product [Medioppia subpectinata]
MVKFSFGRDCDPCKCQYDNNYKGYTMKCMGDSDIDLAKVFETYTKNLTETQKHFKMFYFNNTFVTEIGDNSFKSLTFEWISIEEAMSLEKISKNAFNNETNYATKSIRIHSNTKLSNPDNSLFEALSKFVNIEDIDLSYNNLQQIPANAFKPINGYQTKLKDIIICDTTIEVLGAKAFWSIPALNSLSVYDTAISHIPDDAFAFEKPSNKTLYIFLNLNKSLNSSSYSPKSFADTQRPTELELGHKYTPRQVVYLDEKTFRPFLEANKANKINLEGEEFDCEDCRTGTNGETNELWLKTGEVNANQMAAHIDHRCARKAGKHSQLLTPPLMATPSAREYSIPLLPTITRSSPGVTPISPKGTVRNLPGLITNAVRMSPKSSTGSTYTTCATIGGKAPTLSSGRL